jgi:perosamine synthetase
MKAERLQSITQSPPQRRGEYLAFGRPNFSEAEIEAVAAVMRSGWVGMGTETLAFEEELARSVGAPHVVTVNSCTSALFLSLLALGIGAGDEVICPSLTWYATANAAVYLGATPVFCDIDPSTMCVSPETVAAKLSPATRAVMVVHYGGAAMDVRALRDALPAHVTIVEDAAHALGAKFEDGKPVGSSGNLTCFSFYANKNLSTGEGGAIALFDESMAERLRGLRQSGLSSNAWKRYIHPHTALTPGSVELGYKMNFIDLLAAIGRVQLRRQEEFRTTRAAIARRYRDGLDRPGVDLGFQAGVLSAAHSLHLFVVTLPVERMRLTRDDFILALRERNVGASIHYAPLHSMPLYHPVTAPCLPVTEWLAARNVTLPIGAAMDIDDADYVVAHVLEVMES